MISLISLVVFLIVIGVVIWAAQRLMAAFGIGDPIATVIYVLLVLVLLVFVLQYFGLVAGPFKLQ